MEQSLSFLMPAAALFIQLLSLFPFYAMYSCFASPLSPARKGLYFVLMLLFWPWGLLVYAFTGCRDRLVILGSTVLAVLIAASLVIAGPWSQRVKAGEKPEEDPLGLIAYAVVLKSAASLTRPVYYYQWLMGKDQPGRPKAGQTVYEKRVEFSLNGGRISAKTVSNDPDGRGGMKAVGIKLGPMTEEQRRRLPNQLEVEFEGGKKFPVDMGSSETDSDLIKAVREGNMGAVKSIVERGGGFSALSDSGYTPLMEAVQYGYEDIAAYLIEQGADAGFQAEDGETALTLARKNFRTKAEALITEKMKASS